MSWVMDWEVTEGDQLEIKLDPEPALRRIPASNYRRRVRSRVKYEQMELWDEALPAQ